jgi:hypothetical protein
MQLREGQLLSVDKIQEIHAQEMHYAPKEQGKYGKDHDIYVQAQASVHGIRHT